MLLSIIYLFGLQQVFGKIHDGGILYPKQTLTRQLQTLDGLWNFVVPTGDLLQGTKEQWYLTDLNKLTHKTVQLMPVPSSYNDITVESSIRDHVGPVWYDRRFLIPKLWQSERIWLRFGSVSYAAQVYLNGRKIAEHDIGHLPFVVEVTDYVHFEKSNLLTVMCDNTLLHDTIPQGEINQLSNGRLVQTYRFDFFNYAGIDRSVHLYTTPKSFIDDITISTQCDNDGTGILAYRIDYINPKDFNTTFTLTLYDDQDVVVVFNEIDDNSSGILEVPDVRLWWPYLMDDNPGYLYTLKVDMFGPLRTLLDSYSIRTGFRTISWTNRSLLINNQQLYLYGFGKHEDSEIRGRGVDLPTILKDFNLIKWIGANTFRTSHYPYAEEIMDLADQFGIMVINECPSVNTDIFSDNLLKNHKRSISQLIKRDKNHPSVIMWSAANEPVTSKRESTEYFRKIIHHIKQLDQTRPTTIVEAAHFGSVFSSQYVDVVSFNQYHGWYSNAGNLDIITNNVINGLTSWYKKFNKPVIQQEYGADTFQGLHLLPAFIWSEEYQIQLMSEHFKAFDILREQGWFVGEFIWNFADFKTGQSYTRVGGNKKGLFTRDRQPKSSAFHLRRRYWRISNQIYNATLPDDLYDYVISDNNQYRDEL